MIDERRLEQALTRLAQTDEQHADLKAEVLRAESAVEAVRDAVYLTETGSIEDRKAKARQSPQYQDAETRYFKATRDFAALTNKRTHEVMVVDVFRTLEASRRRGNI